jgi:predicted thioesterase
MFLRRLGQNGRQLCSTGAQCPQILEMVDGDFAAVGLDITTESVAAMPPGPGVGTTERVVKIPRYVMIAARAEIPAA